jgi:hypothetical protein
MTECLVNDVPIPVENRPETWGELLDALDQSLGRDRRVVTAVRFDGVDAPSFREPAQAVRPLQPVAVVEVDAVEASRLLDDALTAAAGSLPSLADGARVTAAAYRRDAGDAHPQLASLMEAIQSLVALTAATATAARVSRGDADAAAPPACPSVEAAVATLVDRHSHGDWPGVADALEHDLAAAVLDWGHVLDAIRQEAA